jgi:type IV pilus assembly protein PilX
MFLMVMTLIGVSGMQTTSLEEKMTSNMRDRSLAFQAAESALRAGETFLTGATLPAFDGTANTGRYTTTANNPSYWDTIDWSDSTKVTTYTGYDSAALAHLAAAPTYIIEQLPATAAPAGASSGGSLEAGVPPSGGGAVGWYRITARGIGGTGNAVVMLQSIFRR